MAITVNSVAPSVPVKPFPKLMKHIGSDLIVFFSAPECGMVLRESAKSNSQGHCSNDWEPSSFIDFNGTLEISNS